MRTSYKILIAAYFTSLLCIQIGKAQQLDSIGQPGFKLLASYTDKPIWIDGFLSEDIWKNTPVAKEFWMNFPQSGIRSDSIQTEVRIVYDNSRLYIAASCFSKKPNFVFTLKRDNPLFWDGDVFGVVLDPMNTKNNGYIFATNPKAVQIDATVGNQNITRETNLSNALNTSWNSKWQCKVTIDVDKWTVEMAIPFRVLRYANTGTWGINFFRRDVKTNTYYTFFPVPVQYQEINLDHLGSLHWLSFLQKTKRIGAISPYILSKYDKDYTNDNQKDLPDAKVGLDAKLAISPGLDLDITVNPDFSQVEADRQVINLSTVNILFPEQRLFFQENSDLFTNFGIPPMRPFYSRRIGLDEDGNAIPILFGARISGAVNQSLRIGLMNMLTKESSPEKGVNYTSAAAHYRLFGKTFFKAYFHNLQDIKGNKLQNDGFNRLVGIEIDYRCEDCDWRSSLGYGASVTPEAKGENGFYKAELGYNGRHIDFFTNIAGVGNNYINEIGFIPRMFHQDSETDTIFRKGFDHYFTRLGYTLYPKKAAINSHRLGIRNIYSITKGGTTFRNEWIPNYRVRFKNTSELHLSYSFLHPTLLYPLVFTDQEPLPSGKYAYQFGNITYSADARKNFTLEAGIQYGGFYNGKRARATLNLDYRVRPWGVFSFSADLNNIRFPNPFGEEKFVLLGSKMELSFSKSLFWTTFFQYNTQRDNFNINSRMQWQINSLSNLFIVYIDNYEIENWGKKNRTLVIKFNYWLDI